MENVTYKMQDNTLVFAFNGKISSENAAAVEEKVNAIVRSEPHQNVIVDAEQLRSAAAKAIRMQKQLIQ